MRSVALGVALASLAIGAAGCRGRGDGSAMLFDVRDAGAGASTRASAGATAISLGPEIVALERVAIRSDGGDTPHELYDDELAKAFGRALSASPGFLVPGTAPPVGVRVRRARGELVVTGEVSRAAGGGGTMSVAVEAALRWQDGEGGAEPTDRVLVERPAPRGGGGGAGGRGGLDGALAALAAEAVGLAAEGVSARAAMRGAADEMVIAEIGAVDPARARWALLLAGERKLVAALEPAAARLGASDKELAGAAVSALVEIGDPRAVAMLTAGADFQDYARLRVLIEAAVALGGEDAIEFLEFLESGHPDAEIKERAAEGLARLRKR